MGEDLGDNVMSGRPGEPGTRWASEDLKEEKPKRGATAGKAKHRPFGTHRFTDQGLEVEPSGHGSRLAGEYADGNGMGARPGDESGRLWAGRNP